MRHWKMPSSSSSVVTIPWNGIKNVFIDTWKRPAHGLLFWSTLMMTIFVKAYGDVYILPQLLKGQGLLMHLGAYGLGAWIFISIWAHMCMVRYRDSKIQGRPLVPYIVLEPPTSTEPSSGNGMMTSGWSGDNQECRERCPPGPGSPETSLFPMAMTPSVEAIQYQAHPFDDKRAWHKCSFCEMYVPPRSWHCMMCRTCVFQRDHHCYYAMTCVGEDNHVHFLGFIFYMVVGLVYSQVIAILYHYWCMVRGGQKSKEITFHYYVLRVFLIVVIMITDPSMEAFLSSITFIFMVSTSIMFLYYLWISLHGWTSGEKGIRSCRTLFGSPKLRYSNMRSLLGPHPILRILWPFSPLNPTNYGLTQEESDGNGNKKVNNNNNNNIILGIGKSQQGMKAEEGGKNKDHHRDRDLQLYGNNLNPYNGVKIL